MHDKHLEAACLATAISSGLYACSCIEYGSMFTIVIFTCSCNVIL